MTVRKIKHIWTVNKDGNATLVAEGERDVKIRDEVSIRHEATSKLYLTDLSVTADPGTGIEWRLGEIRAFTEGGRHHVETKIMTSGAGRLKYTYQVAGRVFGKDELTGVATCLQDADGTPLTSLHLQVNLPAIHFGWTVFAREGWIPSDLDNLNHSPDVV